MRKLSVAFFALTAVLLMSCQKEVDDGAGGGSTGGTKLLRTVAKSGSDSLVTDYNYTSANKLSGFTLYGVQGGQPIDFLVKFHRNGSGIIQKMISSSSAFVPLGIDSIETFVQFDAGNNRYKAALTTISLFGLTFIDSVAYQYDAGGRLSSQIDYADDGTGGGFVQNSKREYTYNGSNLATQKVYQWDDASSTFLLAETYTYEYDTKVNPLQFVQDAPVMGMDGFYSANNTTKTTLVAADPADNFITTDTFTYNTANRPATATSVTGTTTTNISYFYQ